MVSKNNIQQKNIVSETVSALLVSKTITEAAHILNIDRSTLYKRMDSHPVIGDTINRIISYASNTLKIASVKAAEVLVFALDSASTEKRIDAAKDILDRVGLSDKYSINVNQIDRGGPMEIEFIEDEKIENVI